MCPDIPLWYSLLAVYGAVCLVALPGWWLLQRLLGVPREPYRRMKSLVSLIIQDDIKRSRRIFR